MSFTIEQQEYISDLIKEERARISKVIENVLDEFDDDDGCHIARRILDRIACNLRRNEQ